MKKFVLYFVMAILGATLSVQAGAPTAATLYGPISWTPFTRSMDGVGSASSIGNTGDTCYKIYNRDSLKAADTMLLFRGVVYQPGCIYRLQTTDSVGATDTIRIEQVFYATSYGKDVAIGTAECDTIVPQAGVSSFVRWSALTVGNPHPCIKFDVRAISWISAKVAYIRRAELWKGKFQK